MWGISQTLPSERAAVLTIHLKKKKKLYAMTRLMVTDADEMSIHSYFSEGIKENLLEVYICVMFIENCVSCYGLNTV